MVHFLITNLTKSLSTTNSNKCMITVLMDICNSHYDKPVHTLSELKQRNTKIKGDIFEHFCVLYLKHCYGLKQVWLLNNIPKEELDKLNLTRKDYGIDIIAKDDEGRYYAVQAKFRKRRDNSLKKKKIVLGWKQLSTFYALCHRTGPYYKYIVITTADYLNRIGKKTEKDVSIGYHKLKKINHFQWLSLLGISNTLNKSNNTLNKSNNIPTKKELRLKRLQYYEG